MDGRCTALPVLILHSYIRQVNGVKLAEVMFSLLCVCARAHALSPNGLNERNDILYSTYA